MACGAGFYRLAIGTTVLAIVVLLGLAQLEKHLGAGHPDEKENRSR
jgi:uncharacterized membrane protein YhiD involved in acid resistance